MARLHSQLTGQSLHEAFHYISNIDPGAVGPGLYWLDTSAEPYLIKRRNALNSDWILIGGGNSAPAGAGAVERLGFLTPTGTNTATFSNISQDYTSLDVNFAVRASEPSATVYLSMLFNQDAVPGNYWVIRTTGFSWGVFSGVNGADSNVIEPEVMAQNSIGNSASYGRVHIPFYRSGFLKMVFAQTAERMDGFNDQLRFRETYMNWESISAINRIDFILSAGNFVTGSTFTLYGVQ